MCFLKKLQRRIANYRGVAPETSLVSPTYTSIEDVRLESNRIEPIKPEKPDGPAVAKRKYRRHPKVRYFYSYVTYLVLVLWLDSLDTVSHCGVQPVSNVAIAR